MGQKNDLLDFNRSTWTLSLNQICCFCHWNELRNICADPFPKLKCHLSLWGSATCHWNGVCSFPQRCCTNSPKLQLTHLNVPFSLVASSGFRWWYLTDFWHSLTLVSLVGRVWHSQVCWAHTRGLCCKQLCVPRRKAVGICLNTRETKALITTHFLR